MMFKYINYLQIQKRIFTRKCWRVSPTQPDPFTNATSSENVVDRPADPSCFIWFYWLENGVCSLLQKNHIYTSGASGTNAAVIRGALRAERPELLTVILPQSLKKQPPESQELLSKVRFIIIFSLFFVHCIKVFMYPFTYIFRGLDMQVKNVIEKPHNDHLPLIEASRLV